MAVTKLGTFEIEAREPGRLEDGTLRPYRQYRIEIEIDLDRLARQLGPRAVVSKNGTSVLGGGKIRARVVGRGMLPAGTARAQSAIRSMVGRCPDCGLPGERAGHMSCQFPGYSDAQP